MGKGPGVRAAIGFGTLSLFLDLTRFALGLGQEPTPNFLTSLFLILCLSISMGTAISVVLANNYSIGSYSTVYIIVKKYFNVSAQTVFFILDVVLATLVIITSGFLAGVLLAVNAIVAYYTVKFCLPFLNKFFSV